VPDLIDRKSAEAKKQRLAGHFHESILIYGMVLRQTNRPGEDYRHCRALLGIAMSEMWLSQFSNAFDHLDSARKSATLRADHMQLAWATLDLSTLDLILNDPAAAAIHAEEANSQFLLSLSKDGVARALINLGTADFLLGRTKEGREAFAFAVQAAQKSGNQEVLALAWEHLGVSAARMGSLTEADDLLQRAASSWRHLKNPSAVAALSFDLAEVRMRQGRNSEAEAYLSQLNREESKVTTGLPPFAIAHLKARLSLAEGSSSAALKYLRLAAKLAFDWRNTAPPSDRLRTLVLDSLSSVLSDYIEQVSQVAIATGSETLVRESFISQASSRALSLREQIMLSPGIRQRLLSTSYTSLLEQLARAELEQAANTRKDRSDASQIKVRLSEMEEKATINTNELGRGVRNFQIAPENVQRGLSKDEMLLSFYSGKDLSLLWIVTDHHLSVHKLPPAQELASAGALALRSISNDPNDKQGARHRLGRLLFDQIPPEVYRQHNDWIISADELITQLPISALPGLENRLLVCDKKIRFAPIELLPHANLPAPWSPNFLGVGDPIYNAADERLASTHNMARVPPPINWFALPRLPGSSLELKSVAQIFGMDHSLILLGANATVSSIRKELGRKSYGVLHFATHFVQSDPPDGASLVLSLKGDMPEALTPELAATLPLGGTLVVLDGCASGADPNISPESIMGQARGWLIAGSPAVITTLWPTQDSGAFFRLFYGHLKIGGAGPMPEKVAVALQKAQQDMIAGRRPAEEWAPYRVLTVN
jgi:CHAT domain-containing protein/tetratricopeptide (TPR) repeat protein